MAQPNAMELWRMSDMSPLHQASLLGNVEEVKRLIREGANIDERDQPDSNIFSIFLAALSHFD